MKLGQLCLSRLVNKKVADNIFFSKFVLQSIMRHKNHDWGEVNLHDKTENNNALLLGERILSVYTTGDIKIWVITEADRSMTTVLFPDEY